MSISLFGFLDWFSCWKCFEKVQGRYNGQGWNCFMKFGRINPELPGKALWMNGHYMWLCCSANTTALVIHPHGQQQPAGKGMMKCCPPLLCLLCIKLPINRTLPWHLFVCFNVPLCRQLYYRLNEPEVHWAYNITAVSPWPLLMCASTYGPSVP